MTEPTQKSLEEAFECYFEIDPDHGANPPVWGMGIAPHAMDMIRRVALALDAARQLEWQDISTAPKDELLLLAWWEDWPGQWMRAVDFAVHTRGGWSHGSATHWQPLPAPPSRPQP